MTTLLNCGRSPCVQVYKLSGGPLLQSQSVSVRERYCVPQVMPLRHHIHVIPESIPPFKRLSPWCAYLRPKSTEQFSINTYSIFRRFINTALPSSPYGANRCARGHTKIDIFPSPSTSIKHPGLFLFLWSTSSCPVWFGQSLPNSRNQPPVFGRRTNLSPLFSKFIHPLAILSWHQMYPEISCTLPPLISQCGLVAVSSSTNPFQHHRHGENMLALFFVIAYRIL